jgi:predicted nucleic acid-binding protein
VNPVILLDAGPLGLLSNPNRKGQTVACRKWLLALVAAARRVIVPEIADYEVRRELLRANKAKGVAKLDALAGQLEYLPLTTAAMRRAAELWALARQQGQPTAGDNTIDGDMILAAQARTLGTPDVVIATTNIGHLARFVAAELWQNIPP